MEIVCVCVCVCVCQGNGREEFRTDLQSSFVWSLGKPALKVSINWKCHVGSLLCRYHECSCGIRHFQWAMIPLTHEPSSGRPSTSKTDNNVEWVRVVCSDRRLTVRMVGSELNLNHTTVHQISIQVYHEKIVWEHCSQKPNNRTEGQSEAHVFIFCNGSKVLEIS
jgi:hypothetical protein